VDVDDLRETLQDVSISGVGQLSPTKDYLQITGVRLTLQDDGGDAAGVALRDRDTSGPEVRVYDASGNDTTGLIEAEIQGY
jgi:hypothetical protein